MKLRLDGVSPYRQVVMRDMPDAEQRLRATIAGKLESIREIDLVYGNEPNEWAAAKRERLWLEHFTAENILNRLFGAIPPSGARRNPGRG